jgi:hypothetical protein
MADHTNIQITIDLSQQHESGGLSDQLAQLPIATPSLKLIGDTPTDQTWHLLSRLTNVQELTLQSGYEETLNIAPLPHHWPLKRLEISGATGEDVDTPHLLKIDRLTLD